MTRRNRLIEALLLIATLSPLAWLFGESVDQVGILPEVFVLFGLPLVVAAITFARTSIFRMWERLTEAAIVAVVISLSNFGGQQCFERAYNDCIGKAESIRAELQAYHVKHGEYPSELKRAVSGQPCHRCLRGSIVRYSSTHDHYVVSFSDTLVFWEATDTSGWFASK